MLSFLVVSEFVGRTFHAQRIPAETSKDVFSAKRTRESKKKLGLDENHPSFKDSRWCYDTPGVTHPDQVHIASSLLSASSFRFFSSNFS